MAPNNIFQKIIEHQADADIVFEDEDAIAFLDHRPLFPGHVLLIPKRSFQTLMETPDDMICMLFTKAKRLSIAVQDALGCEGIFLAINNTVSQSIPHVHIHIVPRNRRDGLRGFFWPRNPYDDAAHRKRVCEKIKRSLKPLID